MIKQIKIGQKDIHFARIDGKVIYPNYVARENLVLWYDFSGRTNSDVKKGIAEDLSGNGNDGILENFAYESGSGYDSNSYLEFDNVDDFITIPELNLDVNNFTVAVDGEVLSYRGDNVAKINENGLEIGGRNLRKGTYSDWRVMTMPAAYGRTTPYLDILDDWRGKRVTHAFEVKDVPAGEAVRIRIDFHTNASDYVIRTHGNVVYIEGKSYVTYTIPADTQYTMIRIRVSPVSFTSPYSFLFRCEKLERGNKPTDWTPAPEDFQTTKITPIFSNKIKTLMYWNMALTDTELQEVYNVQKYRI